VQVTKGKGMRLLRARTKGNKEEKGWKASTRVGSGESDSSGDDTGEETDMEEQVSTLSEKG
jgi:hypothetical protein